MKIAPLFFLFLSLPAWSQLTHESEIATVTTGGNSRVETYNFKTDNKFEQRIYTQNFGGYYTYGEANNNVSARDWNINYQLEQLLSPKTSVFVGEVIEGFRFRGIKARYNSDIGVKYFFQKSDLRKFYTEYGYRYTIEDRYSPEENQYESKGRLYLEYDHKPRESFSYKLWAEYLPNFTNTEDYIVNFEASITSILTSVFSLKLSYRGLYDDQPAFEGNKNFDYTYTTSLVAKF